VVADTNTVVSGLLWRGNPRQVLEAARIGTLQLYTTASLLAEIEDVLQRLKFARRLSLAGVTSSSLVMGYAARARLIEPAVMAQLMIDHGIGVTESRTYSVRKMDLDYFGEE
jgi:putative PIN family toxin of toxin-antitoxin system